MYKGILLGGNSREECVVMTYCMRHGIPYEMDGYHRAKNDIPHYRDYIPVGGIKFCERISGFRCVPNYYPDFCKDHLYRKVWKTKEWPTEPNVFVKPADRFKRFTGFVTLGGNKKKVNGPYICSERVKFTSEFRYYVVKGKVLYAAPYVGEDEPPKLPLEVPEYFSGALDFGFTSDGKFAIVEAQPPYAIGWYGPVEDNDKYVEFLVRGYQAIDLSNSDKPPKPKVVDYFK